MKLMKPNLAGTVTDLATVKLPVLCTPKFDGIRATVQGGVVYSRTLKPIPNKNIQRIFGTPEYEGCDGELLVGDPTDIMCFRNTTSIVMSDDKDADEVEYQVFDVLEPELVYGQRVYDKRVTVMPDIIETYADLVKYEDDMVDKGWEGIILRSATGKYKQGRSTPKEGGLLKYKRFFDAEATITGWQPRYENTNPKETNELGRSKRSHKQAGMVALDTIGALEVTWKGYEFAMGSGLDEDEAARLWEIRDKLPGMKVKFKYQLAAGVPRFPIYLAIRDKRDI